MSEGLQQIGYAMLPVTLSFEGITKDIADKLGVPLKQAATRAGTDAGASIADGIEKAKGKVESASAKVAAAFKKVEDAAGKVTVAEAKLQALRDKGVTDAGRLAAAEESVNRAKRDLTQATNQHTRATGSLTQAQKGLRDAEKGASQSTNELTNATTKLRGGLSSVTSVSSKASSSLMSIGKSAGIAAAGFAGFQGVKSFLSAGWDRLTAIDNAKAKLGALGHDAQAVTKIMESATESVKGTAFGLGEAAGLAAQAVAAGVKPGKELTDYLSLIGDTAAVAGVGLEEIGSIFTKVQGAGAASNEELAQLADRGIPIMQALAKQMGVPVAEVKKLASEGKVTADVLKSALGDAVGGAAKNMDSTATAAANARAAFGRLSAALMKPIFDLAKDGLKGLTVALDAVKEPAEKFVGLVGDGIGRAFELVKPLFVDVANGVRSFVGAFSSGDAAGSAEGIAGALGRLAEKGRALWDTLVGNVVPAFRDHLVPTFQNVWGVVENLGGIIRDVFGFLAPIVGEVAGVLIDLGSNAIPLVAGAWNGIVDAVGVVADWLGKLTGFLRDNKDVLGAVAGTITAFFLPALISTGATMAANAITTGVMATAFGVYNIATKAAAIATKGFAIAQNLLKVAFLGNPIGLLIAGLVALGAGLVLAWKKSETFRNIVKGAWEWIKDAASAVVDWFTTTAWPMLQAVWDGIKDGAVAAWDLVKGAIETVVDIFKGLGEILEWLWHNVAEPVWNGIQTAIGFAAAFIRAEIEGLQRIWQGIETVLNWLWHNVFEPIWNGIKAAVGVAIDIIGGIIERAKQIFQGIADKVTQVKDWVVERFTAIVDFVKSLPGKIKTAASNMWDSIKDSFKSMVNWLIRFWNGFAQKLSFTVPDIPGVPRRGERVQPIPTIPELAGGGVITKLVTGPGRVFGQGGPTDDKVPAWLSNGESVNTARSTGRYWPLFERLNKGESLFSALRGMLPKFSTGGVVGREPYGLPIGTNTGGYGSSGSVFPQWVHDIESRFGLKASTYPGHQEGSGLNKGIDWSGPVDKMQAFAEYLRSIRGELEQVIWMNPQTGEKIGVADGELVGPGTSQPGYYRDDWSEHTNHVHTRQSYSFGGTTAPQSAEQTPPVVDPGTTPVEGGANPPADNTMTLGQWLGRKIFGPNPNATVSQSTGTSMTIGATSSVASSTPTTNPPAMSTAMPSTSAPSAAAPASSFSAPAALSKSSSKGDVATAIYQEARRRGYSHEEAVAIVSTALQESNLDANAMGGGGAWHGYFQQDSSYADRDDPNGNIRGFFDRLDEKTKADPNSDIWKRIFWLQQRPGESSAEAAYGNGRQAYLDEIKSKRDEAEKLTAALNSAQSQPTAPVSPTVPNSATPAAVDPKKLREAEDKAADAEKKAAVERQKLAEIEANPKAKESAKMAARDRLEKAEREAKQAKDDLEALKNAPAATTSTSSTSSVGSGTSTGTGSSEQAQIVVVVDGDRIDASPVQDLGKILAGGVLETFGLDGSWLPNPAELGIVKMANAILGLKFTPPPWMEGQGAPPPWISPAQAAPLISKGGAPPQTAPTGAGMAAAAFGLDGVAGFANQAGSPIDASININNPQGDPDEIAKRVRRTLPDQRTRLGGVVPVGH